MNRAHLNYWVDFALLLSFLTVGLTGLVKFFFFLNGNTLGLPVRTFNTVHDYAGVTMVVLVGVHLALHWRWIVCMTKNIFGRKKE